MAIGTSTFLGNEITSGGVSFTFDDNYLPISGDQWEGSFTPSDEVFDITVQDESSDPFGYAEGGIQTGISSDPFGFSNSSAQQNGFLSSVIDSLSAGGKKAEELWSSLDKDTKKAVLSVGGGLLSNVYQSNAAKELMNMRLSNEKEVLQERARLEKESEDRKVRRSAHAPIGTQFADTGLLNATMMMGKK
jgi:hypothetical protein